MNPSFTTNKFSTKLQEIWTERTAWISLASSRDAFYDISVYEHIQRLPFSFFYVFPLKISWLHILYFYFLFRNKIFFFSQKIFFSTSWPWENRTTHFVLPCRQIAVKYSPNKDLRLTSRMRTHHPKQIVGERRIWMLSLPLLYDQFMIQGHIA